VSGGLAAVDMSGPTHDVRRLEKRNAVDYVTDVVDPPVRGSRSVSASSVPAGAWESGDDTLGLGHLVVGLAEDGRHFLADLADEDHQVGVLWGGRCPFHAEAGQVMPGPLAWNSSTAQHARPEEAGGTEFLRAYRPSSRRW
jgi:hypothetical protein